MLTFMQDEIFTPFLFSPYKRNEHHLKTLCWQVADTGHVEYNKKR